MIDPDFMKIDKALFKAILILSAGVSVANFFPIVLAETRENLRIDEAIKRSLTQNPDLSQSQLGIDLSEAQLQRTRGAFDWTLTARSNQVTNESDTANPLRAESISTQNHSLGITHLFKSTGAVIETTIEQTTIENNYSQAQLSTPGASSFLADENIGETTATLSISQPLWKNWLASIQRSQELAAETSIDSALSAHEIQKRTLILQVESQYWSAYIASRALETQGKSLRRTKDFLDLVLERRKRGLAEKLDEIQAKSAVKSQELALQEAQKNALREQRKLALLLGEPGKRYRLQSSPKNQTKENLDPERSLKRALKERPEIKQQQAALKAQRHLADSAEEDTKPELNAVASVSGNKIDESAKWGETFSADNPVYQVGLSFSLPLGNDAAEGAASSEKVKLLQKEAELLSLRKRIKDEILQAIDQIDQTQERLQILQELTRLQRSKLEEARERFNQGRASSKLIIDFENELNEAELTLDQERVNLEVARANLRVAEGRVGRDF